MGGAGFHPVFWRCISHILEVARWLLVEYSETLREVRNTQQVKRRKTSSRCSYGAGDGCGTRKVSLKAFTRMTKFASEDDFKDWNFDFAVALGSVGVP